MASPVFFSTGAPNVSRGTPSRNLVEFKAGKMEMKDKTVYPVNNKGFVYIHQSADDNLMHLCWKDRSTGVVEDDYILVPDDCEFKKVKECTTGRVFVLNMKSSKQKMFFWMQESESDKDDQICETINTLLRNPPQSRQSVPPERELQSLLGQMNPEQMAQLLGSNISSANLASFINSAAAARSPSTTSGASISSTISTTQSAPRSENITDLPQMNDFRHLLEGEQDPNVLFAAALAASRHAEAATQPSRHPLDLSSTITIHAVHHLLSDQEFLHRIESFLPPIDQVFMSDGATAMTDDKRKEQFEATVRSQQFKSALSQFCAALQSGQLGPLISQFGLHPACVEAAHQGNLEAFVAALELHEAKKADEERAATAARPDEKTGDKSK